MAKIVPDTTIREVGTVPAQDVWPPNVVAVGSGGGGGDDLQEFVNRIDVSVNKARVDNAQSMSPVLTTQTGTNLAGAYNGGGLGNKAILGIQGFDLMPLSMLSSIVWVWREMEIAHTNPIAFEVYVNVIIEPDPVGNPGVFKIISIANNNGPPIVCAAATSLGNGRWNYAWASAPPVLPSGPNIVQVVNDFGPPFPVIPPDISFGPTWPAHAYFMSTILAAFPNARLRDASSLDGGLPKLTVTPAILFVVGDSNNVSLVSRLIETIVVNGVSV